MNRVILAVALAVAGLVGSSGPASAGVCYGNFSGYTNVHNGSFTSGYSQCSVANAGITFQARAWMTGTCVAGKGCRSAGIQRSDTNCAWLLIAYNMQGNHINIATGVSTPNKNIVINTNTVCGSSIIVSQPAPNEWLTGVRCRVGYDC